MGQGTLPLNAVTTMLKWLSQSPSLNTFRIVDVGKVIWDTGKIIEALFPFLNSAPSMQEFIIKDFYVREHTDSELHKPDVIN